MSSLFDLSQLKTSGLAAGDIIACDPKLYIKFLRHLSRNVKRDIVAKNMIFLTALSAYTDSPINLFLRGESSTGKSYNVTQTLKYFPKNDVWMLGGLSPTALVHMHGVLVDENGDPIVEVSKPGKDASSEQREAYETYKAKLRNARNLIDLRGKILVFLEAPNIETFNMLRPILSHDVPDLSYKFTDKTGKGQLKTQHVIIRGWPATIFCSTQEKYVQDLATRSFTITPEMTERKYKAANVVSGLKDAFPWLSIEDFDFMLLQGYIEFFKKNCETVKVANPYAAAFAQAFPAKYPRSMRDFPHILTLMKVYAMFHMHQRPVLTRKIKHEKENVTEKYVLVTMRDYEMVLALWNSIREQTETSAPGHILQFYHMTAVPLTKEKGEWTSAEAVEHWNSASEDKKSDKTILHWLGFLQSIGYVTSWPDPLQRNRKLFKAITKSLPNSSNFEIGKTFTFERLKEWFNELEKSSRNSTLSTSTSEEVGLEFELTKSLTSNEKLTLEQLYTQHYTAQNFLFSTTKFREDLYSQNKADLEKTSSEVFPIQKLEESGKDTRLSIKAVYWSDELYGWHPCAVCGQTKLTSWQAETFQGEKVWLCEDCKQSWEAQHEAANT